jgi:hypothetical protein
MMYIYVFKLIKIIWSLTKVWVFVQLVCHAIGLTHIMVTRLISLRHVFYKHFESLCTPSSQARLEASGVFFYHIKGRKLTLPRQTKGYVEYMHWNLNSWPAYHPSLNIAAYSLQSSNETYISMPSCDLFFRFKKRLSVFAKAPLFIVFALCGSQAQWDQAAMSASTLFCKQQYLYIRKPNSKADTLLKNHEFLVQYYRAVSNVNATVRKKRIKKLKI